MQLGPASCSISVVTTTFKLGSELMIQVIVPSTKFLQRAMPKLEAAMSALTRRDEARAIAVTLAAGAHHD